MVPAYKPAIKFIQMLKDQKFEGTFAIVSFVNSDALRAEFRQVGRQYAEGVLVTQVVPYFKYFSTSISQTGVGVNEYEECMKKYSPEAPLSFISLEGFIAARVFVAGLAKAGPNLNTETLVDTLETIRDLELGSGIKVSFSPTDHQGSHTVWGTRLDRSADYELVLMD